MSLSGMTFLEYSKNTLSQIFVVVARFLKCKKILFQLTQDPLSPYGF